MKLIVGLGNPGNKYRNNRHNVGFMVIDDYTRMLGLSWRYSQDWMCFYAKAETNVFVKPSTFMNKSGAAVAAVSGFYNIKSEDILVVYDEVDLPFGKIRLAFNGLSAGHHGIDSIIASIGGVEFGRLRVGIGHPTRGVGKSTPSTKTLDVAQYVLEDFGTDERKELGTLIKKCEEALSAYISEGVEATMNKFN